MALLRNLEAIRDSVQVVGAPHDPGTVQIHEGSSGDGGGLTSLGYLLLSVLLFSIASAAFFLFWQIWKRRNQTVADGTDMEMRIQRRYETVEHWVITKRVCPHDEFSNRVLSRFCSSKKKNDTSDTDEEDSWMEGEEDVECPICMSTIGAGDIVSWSANENCSHVVSVPFCCLVMRALCLSVWFPLPRLLTLCLLVSSRVHQRMVASPCRVLHVQRNLSTSRRKEGQGKRVGATRTLYKVRR